MWSCAGDARKPNATGILISLNTRRSSAMANAGNPTTSSRPKQRRKEKRLSVSNNSSGGSLFDGWMYLFIYFYICIESPASRRCFTSDELMKANAIGINTANGCRNIKMRDKTKHFCFCDGDMCNGAARLTMLSTRRIVAVFLVTFGFYFLVH